MEEETYYERIIDKDLIKWKTRAKTNKSIILMGGARRTGKTKTLEHFGREKFDYYKIIEVQNLSSKDVSFLKKKGKEIDNFIEFMMVNGTSEDKLYGNTLIVFDEIQEHNELKNVIDILNRNLPCFFACTGSAMWINYGNGERYPASFESFTMHPFTFYEFINALNKTELYIKEKNVFMRGKDSIENNELAKLYRIYAAVGGMPQAIKKYIECGGNDDCFYDIDLLKNNSILNVYQADYEKYDKQNGWTLEKKYNELKAKISTIISIENNDANAYENIGKSGIILFAHDVKDLDIKLGKSIKNDVFKPYYIDSGLYFSSIIVVKREDVIKKIYLDFIDDVDNDNNGAIWENVVASTIRNYECELFFKFIEKKEESKYEEERKDNHELDFVFITKKGLVVLEAKSGKNKKHISLELGLKKYKKISKAYILSSCYKFNKANSKGPHFIPFYALEFLIGGE